MEDAIGELERYTMGYVDGYLHDGREMLRELIHPGIQVSRLDVSQLTEGIYMVHLGESQQAQRLVIQR